MLKQAIGKRSEKVKNTIEKGAVLKFAKAIGDLSPIYLDEQVGAESIYKRNIAPPTFPVTFETGTIEELKLPAQGLIHGEEKYHYNRPLFIGEDVYCWMKVKDYYEKSGGFGDMGFLAVTTSGEDAAGNLLFTVERVVIINEAARKGMEV